MHVTDELLMLMSCKWMNDGKCYIGVNVVLDVRLCAAPSETLLWGRSSPRSPPLCGPLESPEDPCVSVSYCSHCTHRILHLHVAHAGVWSGFGPVGQLLVAAGFSIQQVGQRPQLEVVSI